MRISAVREIVKKEMRGYFFSPIAYIVIAFFLVITGVFFFFLIPFFPIGQATLRNFFFSMPYIFSFTVSALTMRLYSEEYRSGAIEVLGTLPLTRIEILAGKFFASVGFLKIMLLFTISYPISIAFLGKLDWGVVIGGYIGLIFLGSAYAAIGLFASAITDNQITAFFLSFTITLLLSLLDSILIVIPGNWIDFLQFLSSSYHFKNISRGVLDSRDIIYFISVIFIALHAAYLAETKER